MRPFCIPLLLLGALSAAAQDTPPPTPAPVAEVSSGGSAEPAAPGETLVSWDEADKHVGEDVTVTGKIADVHCSQLNCLLAFEPSFNRFTAVVPVNRFDIFPPEQLQANWKGKQVRVSGRIIDNGNKPEIIVQSADALRISRGERRRERDQQRQDELEAQSAAFDRLDDALGRVEELTERLAQSETRLENLLALLDQRMAALAAMQAPVGGEPAPAEPRTWETLRTIKRGMSARDVERLAGQPARVEQGANGWEIWYYPSGQSVSFDRRGRAQSVAGFPAP